MVVDDCLGLGILGNNGRGSIEVDNVLDWVDIITGSFGKTLGGSNGGFVTGKKEVIDYLR